MTARVVFADPPLPAPTSTGAEGPVWSIDGASGASVWLHDGRICCSPGRGEWSLLTAERFDLAIRAAMAAANSEWRAL